MKRTFCKEKGRMIDFGKILHYDTSIHKNVLEKRSGMTYERYKKSKNKKADDLLLRHCAVGFYAAQYFLVPKSVSPHRA